MAILRSWASSILGLKILALGRALITMVQPIPRSVDGCRFSGLLCSSSLFLHSSDSSRLNCCDMVYPSYILYHVNEFLYYYIAILGIDQHELLVHEH